MSVGIGEMEDVALERWLTRPLKWCNCVIPKRVTSTNRHETTVECCRPYTYTWEFLLAKLAQPVVVTPRCKACYQPAREKRAYCSDYCWKSNHPTRLTRYPVPPDSYKEMSQPSAVVGQQGIQRRPQVVCMAGDWADEMENL